mmetsp:Transcript_34371/g.97643  ORF Transcript_34371/g.97643 Transcript_34371/m.97643 type:complete len:233 (+) Transcript_34371:1517-2215(+)
MVFDHVMLLVPVHIRMQIFQRLGALALSLQLSGQGCLNGLQLRHQLFNLLLPRPLVVQFLLDPLRPLQGQLPLALGLDLLHLLVDACGAKPHLFLQTICAVALLRELQLFLANHIVGGLRGRHLDCAAALFVQLDPLRVLQAIEGACLLERLLVFEVHECETSRPAAALVDQERDPCHRAPVVVKKVSDLVLFIVTLVPVMPMHRALRQTRHMHAVGMPVALKRHHAGHVNY